jgi:N-acetylgalactosamine kinase
MTTRPTGEEQIARLATGFRERFGRRPEVVVRAPGRVNLIGEHTDYNGLPVLPMAIERSILVAGAARDDRRVRLANVDGRFRARSYALRLPLRRFAAGDWGNYHKAAAAGLLGALGEDALSGGDFLVDGNIPAGAGLSSSSALVVGGALALLAVSDRSTASRDLAELLARAERYAGTESGGMDQAVCLLAEAGRALRIDFDPLRTRPVPLLPQHRFVVCHSLAAAEKSGAARAAYNHRVAECRLACRVLDHALGASLPRPLAHFGNLVTLFPDRRLTEFAGVLESVLPPRPLALAEVAAILRISVPDLATAVGVGREPKARYALLRRARHVLGEAERVDAAERALASGDHRALAALMDASHASCRDDYEISSPALEATVAAAKHSGALGVRLTGAGFGGCTLNLVAAADVESFVRRMEETFYRPRGAAGEDLCFAVNASAGASVVLSPTPRRGAPPPQR